MLPVTEDFEVCVLEGKSWQIDLGSNICGIKI